MYRLHFYIVLHTVYYEEEDLDFRDPTLGLKWVGPWLMNNIVHYLESGVKNVPICRSGVIKCPLIRIQIPCGTFSPITRSSILLTPFLDPARIFTLLEIYIGMSRILYSLNLESQKNIFYKLLYTIQLYFVINLQIRTNLHPTRSSVCDVIILRRIRQNPMTKTSKTS